MTVTSQDSYNLVSASTGVIEVLIRDSRGTTIGSSSVRVNAGSGVVTLKTTFTLPADSTFCEEDLLIPGAAGATPVSAGRLGCNKA